MMLILCTVCGYVYPSNISERKILIDFNISKKKQLIKYKIVYYTLKHFDLQQNF